MKTNYAQIRSFMAKNAPEKFSEENLAKESKTLFEKKLAEDEKLLAAYEAKKLKSKAAIARARALKNKANQGN